MESSCTYLLTTALVVSRSVSIRSHASTIVVKLCILESVGRSTALLAEAVVASEAHDELTDDNKRIEG